MPRYKGGGKFAPPEGVIALPRTRLKDNTQNIGVSGPGTPLSRGGHLAVKVVSVGRMRER